MARHGARLIAVKEAFSQTTPAATPQAFAAGLARARLRPWARLRRIVLSNRRASEAEGASCPRTVDRRQFEAALPNIAMNTRDAMRAGGSMQIIQNNFILYNSDQKWYYETSAGEFIEVAVNDVLFTDIDTKAELAARLRQALGERRAAG